MIDIVGAGIDVTKDWRDSLPLEGMRGSNESEGRDDHFARQAQRTDYDPECDRGIAGGDAMFDADEFRHAPLKFLDIRSPVGEPTPVQDVIHAPPKISAIANIWTSYVKRIFKGRATAEKRKIGDPLLGWPYAVSGH